MRSNYVSVQDFLEEVRKRESSKADYIVPSDSLVMKSDKSVAIAGVGDFNLDPLAHGQLAEKLGIPKRYYDEIGAIEGLRTINVNEQLKHREPTSMIRTLNDSARAVLSDRYKPIDNFPVLCDAILPVVSEFPQMQVISHSLTDRRMYLQFIIPSLEKEIRKGDILQYGITVTNSEVGLGALDIKSFIYRLICENGAIGELVMRKYHSGRRIESDSTADVFSHETLLADVHAYKLQVRDILKHVLTEVQFHKMIADYVISADIKIEKPVDTVRNVTKKFQGVLAESDIDSILNNMVQSGDMSKYGLANAVTFMAHDAEVDKAYELEKVGHKIIVMPQSEWKMVA